MKEILVRLTGIWHKRGSLHRTACDILIRDMQKEKVVVAGKYQHIPNCSQCPDCFVEPEPYYGLVFTWGGLLRSRIYGSAAHKERYGYSFQKPHGFTVRQAGFVSKEMAVLELRIRALSRDINDHVIQRSFIHKFHLGGGTLFVMSHSRSGGATVIYYPPVEINQGPTVIYGIRGNAVVAEAMKHIKAINEQ